MKYLGSHRNFAFYEEKNKSVVVNTKTLTASVNAVSLEDLHANKLSTRKSPEPVWAEVAAAAVKRESAPEGITLSESNKRTYTVPKRASENARTALKQEILSPTAKYVAELLSSGEQLACEDVLWCSRFFENHAEQSTDRALWLAWGGQEGKRWSEGLATRLDYDSITADAGSYETPGVQEFVEGDESDRTFWAMLTEPLGRFASNLFKLTASGTWQAWGNGDWIECDEPEFSSRFVELDDEAALYLAGALFDAPDTPIDLRTPNPDAWDIAEMARDEIDWDMIDRVQSYSISAAGDPVNDGYTPEERAANAEGQVRDANGRFAEVGATGAVKSTGIGGKITAANPKTKQVTVQGVDGKTYEIPADDFEVGAAPHPKVDPSRVDSDSVNFTGILSDTPEKQEPRATMPGLSSDDIMPPVTINEALDNYAEYANAYRQGNAANFHEYLNGEHPSIAEAIGDTDEETPVVAAAEQEAPSTAEDIPEPSADPTPDKTDVQPVYFAIVDSEDPQAVTDLVALVPASATSNEPKTFRRSGGKWVEDPKILADLRSATPPAVVQLTDEQYQDVLGQVDMVGASAPADEADAGQSIVAAGGLDRNRGNAEQLRRYWVHGEGALKIRWGTPGDFNRCVRLLTKHLGPRAKGYCQLRHKEATGIYTSTHAKNDKKFGIEDSPRFIVVVNPSEGDTQTCPGCDQDVHFDPLDGYQAGDGSISHEDGTTHSDYIGIQPPEDMDDDYLDENLPSEVEDGLRNLPEDDEEYDEYSLSAAGGLDRNRGNAETLRHYWTVGPGGLKIAWDTPGDWTRCVRLLSKHLGPRAKGYCALRHKEMTGMWPGDKQNREMSSAALTASGSEMYSTDYIRSLPAVLRASANAAAVESARIRVRGGEFTPIPPDETAISEGREGRAFKIPVVIPEGLATGDGRTFEKGSLGMRTLPLPLLWQLQTGEGHDGSVLVGKITHVERTPFGLGNAYGVFDTGPYGQEAQRLVENGFLRWISADLDKFEVNEAKSDMESGKMFIQKGRLMGATLVPKPAFQECTIELIPLSGEETEMPDAAPSAITASASIAEAIPVEPPSTWFDRPVLNGPTPITVDDNGHVFGHIATWSQDHIGHNQSVRAPRSASNYAYFHTGVVRTAEGQDVKVGQLTLAGGHAPLNYDPVAAVKHYDDTASAVADVHAGEDAYGIWVSGALRPGTTPEQIRALRASAPSGDWRSINHRLELVAVCQVNVPGFPVPRSMTASGSQDMYALVAAGAGELVAIRNQGLEAEHEALVAAARSRLFKALDIDGYMTEFKTFSKDKRDKLAKDGKALPDGSFPIENVADLRRAVHAYGRASDDKKAKVRRHIVKRARALGKHDLIPSSWKEASLSDKAIAHRDKYDAMVASARAEKVAALRDRVHPPTKEDLEARVASLRSRIEK